MRTQRCILFFILIAASAAAPAAEQQKSGTIKWLERAQRAGIIDKSQVEDVRLEELLQKQKHHELIGELEPKLESGEVLPAARLYMLARAYSEIRNYTKTLATADALEARIRAGDDHYNHGALAPVPGMLRAFVALEQGDLPGALKDARLAREQLEKAGKNASLAENFARNVLMQSSRGNDFYLTHLIEIDMTLGIASALLGDDAEADRAAAEIEHSPTSASVLAPQKFQSIARIRMAQRRFDKALAAVQNPAANTLGVFTVFYDKTFQEIPKYFILTKSFYETGKLREAKAGYDQLLKHPQIAQIGGIHWPVLFDRARIASSEGEQPQAEQLLRQAVDVIESQRASINTEAGRIGFVGDKQAVYQELVSLLVDGGQFAEAFRYAERAKGRALVDLLASQQNIARHATDGSAPNDTAERLARAERELNVVVNPADDAATSGTRGLVADLRQKLVAQDPDFASLVSVASTDLGDVQQRLDADETLLEYYATERDWYVFVVRRDGISAQKLALPDVEKDVLGFREALAGPGSDDYKALSAKLHASLIAPIAKQIAAGRLTIVPHGVLHYLPFGAISAGGEYLVDRHSIRMLPSASVLTYLTRSNAADARRMLILGNPDLGDPRYDLKFAEEEARAIAKIVPGATVLLRSDARAAAVVRDGAGYGGIHFAAHGVFDPDSPLDSALILAGDGPRSGWLRAKDLYGLRLNADLVALSACETALGKVSRGDDVVGFTRGFLYAGARSILSSLWKVDDLATRDLMVDFYGRLPRTDKDEALRQAQLTVKKANPHPYYWAAFELTGRAR